MTAAVPTHGNAPHARRGLELEGPFGSPSVGDAVVGAAPSAPDEFAALEHLARVLAASGQFEILRRFRPRARYAAPDGQPTRTALFVDVETTGLDHQADVILQLCCAPFTYGVRDGRLYDVGDAQTYFEDPGRPIPPEITALTGIDDALVRGQRIDDAAVDALVARSAVVIAHNAAFDRPMLERRLPAFARKPWACSCFDVPWARHGIRSTKLDYLLVRHAAEVHDGHRADADCHAGIHLLATPFACGTRPMALLLAASRAPTARILALDAPFSAKAALKTRGYRWCDGAGGRPRAWYVDLPPDREAAECQWLAKAVYGGAGRRPWQVRRFGAVDRYSCRV